MPRTSIDCYSLHNGTHRRPSLAGRLITAQSWPPRGPSHANLLSMYAVRRALGLIISPILFCGELDHEEPIGENQWGLTTFVDDTVGPSPWSRHINTEAVVSLPPTFTLPRLNRTCRAPPFIPTEICELIIDAIGEFLCNATQVERQEWLDTLRSCVLVCKRWRVRSQLLLSL